MNCKSTMLAVVTLVCVLAVPSAFAQQDGGAGGEQPVLQWTERPTGAHFARNYPRSALRDGVEGGAILECLVLENGSLECTVLAEAPEQYEFGRAALRVARHFRLALHTTDGAATAGGTVQIPIRFRLR